MPVSVELVVTASPGPVLGSVCTGYGGLDLGVLAAFGGGRIAWVADPDPHVTQVLAARMPGVSNLGDVRTLDWRAVEPVEVLTAGFPCQDISAAGRRAGIENGARSGVWTDIMAGVRVLRPALLVVENVAALRWKGGGLHRVLGDLAEAGYDTIWRSVRAADVGAPHRRERLFLLAWPRAGLRGGDGDAADTDGTRRFLQRHLGGQQARRTVAVGPHATAPHTDRLGCEELHAPDSDRRTVAARRGPVVADAASLRHRDGWPPGWSGLPAPALATGPAAGDPGGAPADASGDGRDEGLPGSTRLQGRPDAALRGHEPGNPGTAQRHLALVPNSAGERPAHWPMTASEVDWAGYAAAVLRWERTLGRRTPFPTQTGRHGRPVLAPVFVEHLMGLPPGWVTDLPLPRTAQLRALGNGVVPHQATHAIALLLADLAHLLNHNHTSTQGREANAA